MADDHGSARPRLRLPGRHVAVTGAAGGIGTALARAAAAEGAVVGCVDIDLPGAQRCADELTARGFTAYAVRCDITDPASCAGAVVACIAAAGPVDVLFANAGGAQGGAAPFLDITPESFATVVERNLHGAFFSGQAFARHMASRAGARSSTRRRRSDSWPTPTWRTTARPRAA